MQFGVCLCSYFVMSLVMSLFLYVFSYFVCLFVVYSVRSLCCSFVRLFFMSLVRSFAIHLFCLVRGLLRDVCLNGFRYFCLYFSRGSLCM